MVAGQESADSAFIVAPIAVADLPSFVALENECGLNSRGVEGHRKKMLDPNSILLAAIRRSENQYDREIIGVFSGDVVVDELQIDNLAVRESWRRKGVGRMLLKSALSAARRLGAGKAVLEVRSAKLSARTLYERAGFVIVGLRKDYYTDPPDDALLLHREIDG